LLFAMIILCVMAGWSALRSSSSRAAPASKGWLFLVIPVALLISFGHSNWLLRTAQFRIYDVPSTGMEQTIEKGDRILADLLQYRHSNPKPRDIILLRKDDTVFVKRVVATSGSTINGKEDVVFVDGVQLEEPYVEHVGNPPEGLRYFGPIRVPPGKVFVMGDNRDVSNDSRMLGFGLVSEDTVVGKALYIMRSKSKRGSALR
jgi:signal peptidase I